MVGVLFVIVHHHRKRREMGVVSGAARADRSARPATLTRRLQNRALRRGRNPDPTRTDASAWRWPDVYRIAIRPTAAPRSSTDRNV